MKYLYFAILLALMVTTKLMFSFYDESQQLKDDKVKLEQSLTDAQNKNASLNETISKQAETQQSIDDTQKAIRDMHKQISTELQRTKNQIKNQIKGLPCYEQTIPADAIDAICIMQPSNAACHVNDDKNKGGNSSSVDASKTKAN